MLTVYFTIYIFYKLEAVATKPFLNQTWRLVYVYIDQGKLIWPTKKFIYEDRSFWNIMNKDYFISISISERSKTLLW